MRRNHLRTKGIPISRHSEAGGAGEGRAPRHRDTRRLLQAQKHQQIINWLPFLESPTLASRPDTCFGRLDAERAKIYIMLGAAVNPGRRDTGGSGGMRSRNGGIHGGTFRERPRRGELVTGQTRSLLASENSSVAVWLQSVTAMNIRGCDHQRTRHQFYTSHIAPSPFPSVTRAGGRRIHEPQIETSYLNIATSVQHHHFSPSPSLVQM